MKVLDPIKPATLCFVFLLLCGPALGRQLDRDSGFLDITGARTGFFETERIDVSSREPRRQQHGRTEHPIPEPISGTQVNIAGAAIPKPLLKRREWEHLREWKEPPVDSQRRRTWRIDSRYSGI